MLYRSLILPDLRVMLQENDTQGLREFCEALHPATAADALEGLDSTDEVWKVLSCCDMPKQVEIFEFLGLPKQVELVDALDRERLSRLLEAMAPDDRADLLSRLDTDRVETLLPLIAKAERADIRKLLSYPEDSAGAIMTTEYAFLPENISVTDALQQLRRQAPDRETIYYIYVVDEGRHLKGFVSLRDLILARPTARVVDVMTRDVISVRVDDDQEFVAQELGRYDFIAIPVVDNQNRLVGIVTHDDVLDVVQQEATEDAHRLGAVEPLEDSYLETPLRTLAWKRGGWLLFLAVVALATAEVLQQYESVSETFVWLVRFLPLVLASGGNTGSQSATLIIRTLALGEFRQGQNLRILNRELAVGAMLGICLATLGFVAAVSWFGLEVIESGVVGLTVLLVVLMGTFFGALLPLGCRRVGWDPALMSNPLIAALVDVLGVVIYYNIARWLLTAAV